MSDLPRNLRTQPLNVPVMGTPDGVYDAPGEDWDGQPVRVSLSNGEEVDGFVPGTRIDAETHNALLGRLGEALASIIDSPALSFTPALKSIGDDPPFAGMGNGLFAGPVVAPALDGGHVLAAVNSDGIWTSKDGRRWDQGSALGFGAQCIGMAASLFGAHQDLNSVIVVMADEGSTINFRFTEDGGNSFSDGGDLGAANTAANPKMGFFQDRFLVAFINQGSVAEIRSNDNVTANGEWDVWLSGFGDWTVNNPICFAANSEEVLLLIDGDPRVLRSSDGETWAAANTGLTGTPAALCWSESHGLWLYATEEGDFYTAPAGAATWTARTPPAHTSLPAQSIGIPYAIGALGRTILMAAGPQYVWASRDLERWAKMIPHANLESGSTQHWEWILPFNGALWVAQRSNGETAGTSFESTTTGVLAPELVRLLASGGW